MLSQGFAGLVYHRQSLRKHGIYEGSVVKPVGADFVEQKFFRNILVTVGVGRSALCPTWSMV
ncbi:MAG TPA: hypothetical protein VK395_08155 [Gemmataceae bacterium]|nr:hypothetical protein [Gemmataceae bacterium]